jgi:hypothetical protein
LADGWHGSTVRSILENPRCTVNAGADRTRSAPSRISSERVVDVVIGGGVGDDEDGVAGGLALVGRKDWPSPVTATTRIITHRFTLEDGPVDARGDRDSEACAEFVR